MSVELDGAIVEWIGRLGAASVEQVMARFGIGRTWAYIRLGALARDGLLTQHHILHGRPTLYLATRRGLRWRNLSELGLCAVSAARFEHMWQVTNAAVALAAGLPDWRILSDREILWRERQGPKLLASVRVGSRGGGVAALHRPDLALLSPRERVVAIEVELALKDRARLVAICNGWARARHLDAVYYLATPSAMRGVGRAAKRTRAEDYLTLLPLGETAEIVRRERAAAGDDADEGEER